MDFSEPVSSSKLHRTMTKNTWYKDTIPESALITSITVAHSDQLANTGEKNQAM